MGSEVKQKSEQASCKSRSFNSCQRTSRAESQTFFCAYSKGRTCDFSQLFSFSLSQRALISCRVTLFVSDLLTRRHRSPRKLEDTSHPSRFNGVLSRISLPIGVYGRLGMSQCASAVRKATSNIICQLST